MREMTYVQALNEALHQAMSEDPSVFVIGGEHPGRHAPGGRRDSTMRSPRNG